MMVSLVQVHPAAIEVDKPEFLPKPPCQELMSLTTT